MGGTKRDDACSAELKGTTGGTGFIRRSLKIALGRRGDDRQQHRRRRGLSQTAYVVEGVWT